nr:MobA/MobL family protein [Magnetofaba australis]
MPSWINGGPMAYWINADRYERTNGTLFREVEFALPRDLHHVQQIDLTREYVAELTASGLPHTWAIHRGENDNGEAHNPHVHLMISERRNDGIMRSAQGWFKRAAVGNQDPASGGARKVDIGGSRKAWLANARARWAEVANTHLRAAGRESEIDHRSLAEQGIQRIPQRHLGPRLHAMEAKGIVTDRKQDMDILKSIQGELESAQREIGALKKEQSRLLAEYYLPKLKAQIQALGCAEYGVRIGRGKKYKYLDQATPKQVLSLASELIEQRRLAWSFEIQPAASLAQEWVLVEGVRQSALASMREEGVGSVVSVALGEGRHQAWVRLVTAVEPSGREEAVAILRERYAPDGRASVNPVFGEAAGWRFLAKVAESDEVSLLDDVVSVTQRDEAFCSAAFDLIIEANGRSEMHERLKRIERWEPRGRHGGREGVASPQAFYLESLHRQWREQGRALNWAFEDRKVVGEMVDNGYSALSIARALEEFSPEAARCLYFEAGDLSERYAEVLVDKVLQERRPEEEAPTPGSDFEP